MFAWFCPLIQVFSLEDGARMTLKWLPLLLLACSLFEAKAQTINAATCTASDVQAAFNAVTSTTTTINIPAGVCTWTTQVTLYVPPGSTTLSILGAGNQSTGGGDVTVINDNDTTHSNYLLQLNTGAAASHFRFAGVTLSQGTGSPKYNGELALNGYSQNLRLDHLHVGFQTVVRLAGWMYGVLDHSIFDNGAALEVWMDEFNNTNGTQNSNFFGDGSWAAATNFGSANAFFIEDNIFNQTTVSGQSTSYMSDCYSGGRFVVRHNTLNNVGTLVHPTGGAGRIRGCRSEEIYGNTYNGAVSPATSTYDAFWDSAGTALVWGNVVANYKNFIDLHSMRINNNTYPQLATLNGWGYCGSAFNGIGSNWDQNTVASTGYACIDQPGRGIGDLLTSDFPNITNTTSGTIAWPHQALEPVYEWLNTYTPASGSSSNTVSNSSAPSLQANVDYYVYTSSFTGASGTGSGTLAARPPTCTTGVAYWATDQGNWNQSGSGGQGELFKCTATNTWTLSYTPYAYPHPLTGSAPSQSPAPALSLRATKVQ
jgi:hypothetical protein